MDYRKDIKIAVVGATGAVGRVTLDLLSERGHPKENILCLASKKSAGKTLSYKNKGALLVEEAKFDVLDGVDFVFISATNEVSKVFGKEAAKRGCIAIDDSSVFRTNTEVPLVVPEVNGEDVKLHKGIIAIPNCSVTPLVMVLKPLSTLGKLKSAHISTYQSVSGAGASEINSLEQDTKTLLQNGAVKEDRVALNVVPKIGEFREDGFTEEEQKTVFETKKIMHTDNLELSATCVRVPVKIAHSIATRITFDSKANGKQKPEPEPKIKEVKEVLAKFSGVEVVGDGVEGFYTPREAANKNPVFVGRIRYDLAGGLHMWISCDNLKKGAALNALQIMDEVIKRGTLNKS